MKLVKITHYQDSDPEEEHEYVIKEGSFEEIKKVAKRYVDYVLPKFEGLQCIAADVDYITFADNLNKYAYWVRLEIRD